MTENEPQDSGENYRVETSGVSRGVRVGSSFAVSDGLGGNWNYLTIQDSEMDADISGSRVGRAKANTEEPSSSCCSCSCKVWWRCWWWWS